MLLKMPFLLKNWSEIGRKGVVLIKNTHRLEREKNARVLVSFAKRVCVFICEGIYRDEVGFILKLEMWMSKVYKLTVFEKRFDIRINCPLSHHPSKLQLVGSAVACFTAKVGFAEMSHHTNIIG